jgi:PKD repeat protein
MMKKIYVIFSIFTVLGISNSSFGQQVLTLQPGPSQGIDTYLCSALPYQIGYGFGMLVTAWTYGGDVMIGKDLLKFNLNQLPANAMILDAKLSLYYDPNGSQPGHSGANASCIKRVTSDWDVMTVCWMTMPSATDLDKIDLPETTDPYQDFTDINITKFVTGWLSDPSSNFGMLIGLYTQDPFAGLILSSSDEVIPSKRPKLVITYVICDLPVAGFTANTNAMTVSFTDASANAQSWQWNFGDGFTSYTRNPIHTYASTGKYQVCLTVQDTCGSDTFCDSVQVTCAAPATNWGYSSNGTILNFFDSTGYGSSWFWDFGDGYSSSLVNPTHQYDLQGKYYVCLTVQDSCGSATHCDTVHTCTPMGTKFGSQQHGHLVSFADSSQYATSWIWNFGDGFSSILENPTHYYEDPGTYDVCLTSSNTCESKTWCDSLYVAISGISENHQGAITLFPNPFINNLVLHKNNMYHASAYATISTIRGEVVFSGRIFTDPDQTEASIDCSFLKPGLYIVSLTTGTYVEYLKIVKTN